MFNMLDRSLAHTKWLFKPNIWAANCAAPSGDRVVGQPRPAEKRAMLTQTYSKVKQKPPLKNNLRQCLVQPPGTA